MAISLTSLGSVIPSFLGKSLTFPMQLDATGGRPSVSQDDILVFQSMDQIINTNIGERPFLVKNGIPYGTRVRRVLFDSASTAISIIEFEIKRALDTWEPRIIVDSVDAQEVPQANGASKIISTIFFRFRSTNRSDNFVVPFSFQRAA